MENTLQFELTERDANIILNALGKLPAETSMGVILKLQQQAAPQIKTQPQPSQEAEVVTE
jgi:hypothetical protein